MLFRKWSRTYKPEYIKEVLLQEGEFIYAIAIVKIVIYEVSSLLAYNNPSKHF